MEKEINIENSAKRNVIVDIVLKKRVPEILHSVLYYLCLCFGNWFEMRRVVAGVLAVNSQYAFILGNNIVCFLIAGIMPLVVFELAKFIAFSLMKVPTAPPLSDMNYALRTFYGLGFLIYGAFSMLYFAFPVIAFYGEVIIKFLILSVAVAFYILFEAKFRLPKRLLPRAIYSVGGVFVFVNLAWALYAIISYLTQGVA